ncbi:MAG TPA: hypothetical protein P5123_13235 [Spirochaetota bacterium]|nr:hypothetical protein [Spirochaetota bacterium]
MNKNEKFPLCYFFLTFIWSWSLWVAVALSLGQTSNLTIESASPLVIIVMVIGAFGPAFGAILSILTIEGKGAIIPFIKRFVDLRFGITAWIVPFLVLSVGTFMA